MCTNVRYRRRNGVAKLTSITRIYVAVFTSLVHQALAGECCKAYYDLTLNYHDAKWCSDYCCGSSIVGLLDCCDNILLVAQESDRSTLCLDFFAKNIWLPKKFTCVNSELCYVDKFVSKLPTELLPLWAPIVIGLGGLGAMICLCVCVAMCCSSGSRRGAVVGPQQPGANIIMVAGQQPVQGQMPSQMPGQMQGQMGGPAYPPLPGSAMGAGYTQQPPAYGAESQNPTKPLAETTGPV